VLVYPATLWADFDLRFAASTTLNFKEGEYIPKNDPDTGFKVSTTTIDLSLTVFSNRFFVAANYDPSIKDDYTVINGGTIELNTSRLDAGITVGYDVWKGFNVFVVYKHGETEEKSVRTTGTTAAEITFTDKGPFAGIGYGYNFGRFGALSASVAYANFDSEIRRHNLIADLIEKTGGTTSGLSYGVKWSRDIRDGTTLAFGFRKNLYDFVDKDMAIGSYDNSLKQEFSILSAQVTNYFK